MSVREDRLRGYASAAPFIPQTPPAPSSAAAGSSGALTQASASDSQGAFSAAVSVPVAAAPSDSVALAPVRRFLFDQSAPPFIPSSLGRPVAPTPLAPTATRVQALADRGFEVAFDRELRLIAGAAEVARPSLAQMTGAILQQEPASSAAAAAAASPTYAQMLERRAVSAIGLPSVQKGPVVEALPPPSEARQTCAWLAQRSHQYVIEKMLKIGSAHPARKVLRMSVNQVVVAQKVTGISLSVKKIPLKRIPTTSARACCEAISAEQIEAIFKDIETPLIAHLKRYALGMLQGSDTIERFKEHRAFGQLIFYLQLLVYAQATETDYTHRRPRVFLGSTLDQLGVGYSWNETQAAHHAMLPNLCDDLLSRRLLEERLTTFHEYWQHCLSEKDSDLFIEKHQAMIFLLMGLGVPLEYIFEQLSRHQSKAEFAQNLLAKIALHHGKRLSDLSGGFIQRNSLLYLLSNSTCIARRKLNEVDGLLEIPLRKLCMRSLEAVGRGVEPLEAFENHARTFQEEVEKIQKRLLLVKEKAAQLKALTEQLKARELESSCAKEVLQKEHLLQEIRADHRRWLSCASALQAEIEGCGQDKIFTEGDRSSIEPLYQALELLCDEIQANHAHLEPSQDIECGLAILHMCTDSICRNMEKPVGRLEAVLGEIFEILQQQQQGNQMALEVARASLQGLDPTARKIDRLLHALFFASSRFFTEPAA